MKNFSSSNDFKFSLSNTPFIFEGWLELPFPLAIEVEDYFSAKYKNGKITEVTLNIFSNGYKVINGNIWIYQKEMHEYTDKIRKGHDANFPNFWNQEYVTKDKINKTVQEFEKLENSRYVHVEAVPAIVYITCHVPKFDVPKTDFLQTDLMPDIEFFSNEILPRLQTIIDAYRIGARPWMRYSISPISEALIDEAVICFTDKEGKKLGKTYYKFDPKSPKIGISRNYSEIENRFKNILKQISNHKEENLMASAYYLYRMRRWTEAITIASSVVDRLLKRLISELASTEIEEEAIWTAYGNRYKELFNKVFPAFGKPKLSDKNQSLWNSFIDAKKFRGEHVHGGISQSFNDNYANIVKNHLKTFHDVSRWICQQINNSWSLDFIDENNNTLDAFP